MRPLLMILGVGLLIVGLEVYRGRQYDPKPDPARAAEIERKLRSAFGPPYATDWIQFLKTIQTTRQESPLHFIVFAVLDDKVSDPLAKDACRAVSAILWGDVNQSHYEIRVVKSGNRTIYYRLSLHAHSPCLHQ